MLSVSVQGGFSGFGEGTADFNCGLIPGTKVYVCAPKNSTAKASVEALQRAADGFLGLLPFFITWSDKGRVVELRTKPIGTSASGYDGVMGPFSAGMTQLALLGALELLNQAGEITPGSPSDVILSATKETDEALRVQKLAYNATALRNFLVGMTLRFPSLLITIKQKEEAGKLVQPIVLQPLPVDRGAGLKVELPPDLAPVARSARVSRAPVIIGMAALGLLAGLGTAAYAHRRRSTTPAPMWPHGGM